MSRKLAWLKDWVRVIYDGEQDTKQTAERKIKTGVKGSQGLTLFLISGFRFNFWIWILLHPLQSPPSPFSCVMFGCFPLFVMFVWQWIAHTESPHSATYESPEGQFLLVKSFWLISTCPTTVHCCPISRGQVGTTSNYGDGVQIQPCSPDSDNPHWSPLCPPPVLPNHQTMEREGGRDWKRLTGEIQSKEIVLESKRGG